MESYERAKSVLTEHIDVLHKLAEQLLEKETILGAELDELIRQVRPGIDLPERPQDNLDDETEEETDAPSASDDDASAQSDNVADKTDTPADEPSADGAENREDDPSKN